MCENCVEVSSFINKNYMRTIAECDAELIDFLRRVRSRDAIHITKSLVNNIDELVFNMAIPARLAVSVLQHHSRKLSEIVSEAEKPGGDFFSAMRSAKSEATEDLDEFVKAVGMVVVNPSDDPNEENRVEE